LVTAAVSAGLLLPRTMDRQKDAGMADPQRFLYL
jgi:hypothetical protein